jgi:hypothetical protein
MNRCAKIASKEKASRRFQQDAFTQEKQRTIASKRLMNNE